MIISAICTLCTHVSYIWSVISAELKVMNGWSNLQASIPYTIGTMTAGLTAILAGVSSDSKRPGIMALIGAVMVGAGLCMLAVFSDNLLLICVGYGFLVEAGQNFSNVGLPGAALKWVPSHLKGKTAGICTMGTSLSALFLSVLFKIYTGALGFKNGIIGLAITVSAIAAIAASFFRSAPPEVIEMNSDPTLHYKVIKTPHSEKSVKECLMTKEFWAINFAWFLVMAANLAVVSQTISIVNSYSDVSFPSWLFVATGGIVGACGRFFFGARSDKIGVLKMMAILSTVFGISLLVFPFLHHPILLFICYAIFQFVVSGMNATVFAVNIVVFGHKHNGVMSGLGGLGYVFSGIIGPTIASLFKDYLNTYTPAFILFGLIQLLATYQYMYLDRWLNSYNQKNEETERSV